MSVIRKEDIDDVVLIKYQGNGYIIDVRGPYPYDDAFNMLKAGHEISGGKLYVPENRLEWAYIWECPTNGEVIWEIHPVDREIDRAFTSNYAKVHSKLIKAINEAEEKLGDEEFSQLSESATSYIFDIQRSKR